MPKSTSLSVGLRSKPQLSSFSLVELLTVIAIIAILAALTLAAATGIMQHSSRSRAASEIEAMKMNLDSYKIDNGAFPVGNTTPSLGSSLLGPPATPYPLDPVVTDVAKYQTASEALFQALSGQTNYLIPAVGAKSYMPFRANQVGNVGALSYVKDPWNNSYGYSTGDALSPQTKYPNNGGNSYDLWSTAGTTKNTASLPDATKAWIANWQ